VRNKPGPKPKPKQTRDGPTPEQILKKIALVGPTADIVLAEYPLGVLLARKLITQAQHDAGMHYAWLFGKVIGRTKPVSWGERGHGSNATNEFDEEVMKSWKAACEAMKSRNRAVKDAVDNAAVYERLPGFLFRPMRPADKWLLIGLETLAQTIDRWRYNARDAA